MMNKSLLTLLLLAASLAAAAQEAVFVQFYTPSVVRIVKGGAAPEGSFAVTATPQAVAVKTSVTKSGTTYASAALKLSVDRDGTVRFFTPQGKLLLKLIDRELGRTSFYIIREYRGKLSAGFWQTVARIFGNDLKKPYDKFGEDRQVEDLVLIYNSGAFDALYYSMFTK